LRYSFARFLIADGIYAVCGVPLFFFAGAGIVHVLRQLGGHWLVYIAAAAVGAYLLIRYYRTLRERELRTRAPGPCSLPPGAAPRRGRRPRGGQGARGRPGRPARLSDALTPWRRRPARPSPPRTPRCARKSPRGNAARGRRCRRRGPPGWG